MFNFYFTINKNVFILGSFIFWEFSSKLHFERKGQHENLYSETTGQQVKLHFEKTGQQIAIYFRNVKDNGFFISGNFYINSCKFNINFPLCTIQSCSPDYYFDEKLNTIMFISALRYKVKRKSINAKVSRKSHYCPIIYNLLKSNKTQFASVGIFVLIISIFFYFDYFTYRQLSLISFLLNNTNTLMDISDGRIGAKRQNIEFNQAVVTQNEPKRVKLYNVATVAQKIQM